LSLLKEKGVNKYMGNMSRRQFITSIAAMGAGAMLPLGVPFAQTPIAVAKPHRIDVHYHILPQRYFANERARGGLMFPLTNIGMSRDRIQALVDRFAPARAVEELDRNGIATAISSIIGEDEARDRACCVGRYFEEKGGSAGLERAAAKGRGGMNEDDYLAAV
jgi:hypothetical protein